MPWDYYAEKTLSVSQTFEQVRALLEQYKKLDQLGALKEGGTVELTEHLRLRAHWRD